MLIKKIVALCKKKNIVRMLQTDDGQWLGDGVGFYPLTEELDFSESSFCAAYDIPQKKRESMAFDFVGTIPEGFNFSDIVEDETQTDFNSKISVIYGGKCLMPIKTSDGVTYLDRAYLAPIADSDQDITYIFERHSESGVQFFVIKVGLVVVAAILPFNGINEDLADSLKELSVLTKVKLENMRSARKYEQEN